MVLRAIFKLQSLTAAAHRLQKRLCRLRAKSVLSSILQRETQWFAVFTVRGGTFWKCSFVALMTSLCWFDPSWLLIRAMTACSCLQAFPLWNISREDDQRNLLIRHQFAAFQTPIQKNPPASPPAPPPMLGRCLPKRGLESRQLQGRAGKWQRRMMICFGFSAFLVWL